MGATLSSKASLLFLALPLLALLASGCTTTNTSATTNGIAVKSFGPDFSEVYSGETVKFNLLLKNEGSVDTSGVHAELLGLDEDWCSASGTGGTQCRASAGGRLENLPNEQDCQYTGSGFKMYAASSIHGTDGSTHTCSWTYVAPQIAKDFSIQYVPIARTFFPYKSAVTKLITFGSTNEIRRLQDSGSKFPMETVSSTVSPVQLTIETKGPIRFWGGTVAFPLEITITNAGGGAPCSTGANTIEGVRNNCKGTVAGDSAKDRITLRVVLGSNMQFMDPECQLLTSTMVVALYKGKNSIVCDIQASGMSEVPIQKAVTVEAYYEYYTDTTSSIRLTGRRVAGA